MFPIYIDFCCDPTGRGFDWGGCVFLEIFDPCRDQGNMRHLRCRDVIGFRIFIDM